MEKPGTGIVGNKFNIIRFAWVYGLGVARKLGDERYGIAVNSHHLELMTVQNKSSMKGGWARADATQQKRSRAHSLCSHKESNLDQLLKRQLLYH